MGMRWKTFIFAGLVFAGHVPAQQTAAVYKVAIEVSDYPLVFVSVQVNDRQVRALLDTGSSSAVRQSSRLARELKLALVADTKASVQGLDGRRLAMERGKLDTLSLGGMLDKNVGVEVTGDRVESVSSQVGTPFDLILGWGFLSRYHFLLDYRRGLLLFSEGPLPPPGQGEAIPYSIVNRLPVIPASIAGQDVKLLLDTSAPMCNLDAAFAQATAGQILSRKLLLGSKPVMVEWRVKDLSVTRQALGTTGTLGNNLLSRYAVHVNIRERTITLD
jgi:predicted aspartyl protease